MDNKYGVKIMFILLSSTSGHGNVCGITLQGNCICNLYLFLQPLPIQTHIRADLTMGCKQNEKKKHQIKAGLKYGNIITFTHRNAKLRSTWTVYLAGGNQSDQRKTAQTPGRHANSTQRNHSPKPLTTEPLCSHCYSWFAFYRHSLCASMLLEQMLYEMNVQLDISIIRFSALGSIKSYI